MSHDLFGEWKIVLSVPIFAVPASAPVNTGGTWHGVPVGEIQKQEDTIKAVVQETLGKLPDFPLLPTPGSISFFNKGLML